jgi:hypothetical protein
MRFQFGRSRSKVTIEESVVRNKFKLSIIFKAYWCVLGLSLS